MKRIIVNEENEPIEDDRLIDEIIWLAEEGRYSGRCGDLKIEIVSKTQNDKQEKIIVKFTDV